MIPPWYQLSLIIEIMLISANFAHFIFDFVEGGSMISWINSASKLTGSRLQAKQYKIQRFLNEKE